MGSKSCLHVAWFEQRFPFVLPQQCQEPALSFLSTGQQFCCFRGVCRGFHLWLTGRAGSWLTESGSGSYLFLNPVITTLPPTILQTTLIFVVSSKTKLGKDVYFSVGKSNCITTSMNPMWVSCYQVWEKIYTWFRKQDLGRTLLLNQQCSCWDMSSSQTGRTLDEDKRLPAFISVRIWFKPGNGK